MKKYLPNFWQPKCIQTLHSAHFYLLLFLTLSLHLLLLHSLLFLHLNLFYLLLLPEFSPTERPQPTHIHTDLHMYTLRSHMNINTYINTDTYIHTSDIENMFRSHTEGFIAFFCIKHGTHGFRWDRSSPLGYKAGSRERRRE